jgi:hypothetical protein
MAYMATSEQLQTPNWPKIVGHSVPEWLVPAINRVPELLQLLRARDMKADKLTTGVVQAVGLHKLKNQHAKNWQRLKKNVHIIIEAEIRRNITAKDVTVILDDETFLIVFGDDDPDRADRIARSIAKEASLKLSGMESISDLIQVAAFVVQLESKDMQEAVKSGGRPGDLLDVMRRVRERQETEAGPRVVFLPSVNLRTGRVGLFDAEPAFLSPEAAPHMIGKIASAARAVGRATLIQVPVTFETLAQSDSLKQIVDRIRNLTPWTRQRMILRVTEVPDEIDGKALAALVNFAGRGLRGVGIDYTGRVGDHGRVKWVHPQIINVPGEGQAADALFRTASYAIGAALTISNVKPRVMVRGVGGRDLLGLLERIGVYYVNGIVVAAGQRLPERPAESSDRA